jgi:hypothetical protein
VKPNEPTHGYSGPLKVSYGGTYTNVGEQFLDVAQKYDLERGPTDDCNGLYTCDSYAVSPVYLFGMYSNLTTEMAKVRFTSMIIGHPNPHVA